MTSVDVGTVMTSMDVKKDSRHAGREWRLFEHNINKNIIAHN